MNASRIGLIPAALYLLAVLASGVYVVYRANYAPENSEFAAFGVVVLTLPWSMVLDRLFDAQQESSMPVALGRLGVYALINAAILYSMIAVPLALAKRGGGRPADLKRDVTRSG